MPRPRKFGFQETIAQERCLLTAISHSGKSGAPRPMKMGTASPWRYDAAACWAIQSVMLRAPVPSCVSKSFSLVLPCLSLLLGGIVASAVADAATPSASVGGSAVETSEQWQTVELQSSPRGAAQVEVLIQTDGPRMTGLIRIPGAPASNFDTGIGKTVVDLVNVGDETAGYAEITTVEVQFTQAASGQPFLGAPVGYED
jgi:hypothetical protein